MASKITGDEGRSRGESFLLTLPRFADAGLPAVNPGLDRIRVLLDGMARPQERYPAVLIAGTNGKGSVASMVAAIGTAAGLRVGLHTSPHLFTVRERMRIDGTPASVAWLDGAVERYRDLIESVSPSFFEATVALSLLYFADREVDIAVVEVGLGGRLDATNILEPRLTAITSIGFDHQELLGDTLGAIAREKAGIARSGVPLLTSVPSGEAFEAITDEAARRGTSVESVADSVRTTSVDVVRGYHIVAMSTPDGRYERVTIGLAGAHQVGNAKLAVRLAEMMLTGVVSTDVAEQSIGTGLEKVRELAGLKGRTEVLQEEPLLMADVAHNPEGVSAALGTFIDLVSGRKTVVVGMMRDKDLPSTARLLARNDLFIACVPLPGDRAAPVDELIAILRSAGANVEEASCVQDAIARFHRDAAPVDGLLTVGSHQVVAEAIAAIRA